MQVMENITEQNADQDAMKETQSYANAIKKPAAPRKKPVYKHLRPRSLFLKGPEELDFDIIMDELDENKIMTKYTDAIEALYELRRGIWILTLCKDEENTNLRDKICEEMRRVPENATFQSIQFELPRLPATHLIIKGIPTESTADTVINQINKYGFGKVVNTTRVYRKGTKIYNGHTNVWMEPFTKEKMPSYIDIDGYTCLIRTAEDIYHRKCFRCNATDHMIKDCPIANGICTRCKKEGHEAKNCIYTQTLRDERRTRLGAVSGVATNEERLKRDKADTNIDWYEKTDEPKNHVAKAKTDKKCADKGKPTVPSKAHLKSTPQKKTKRKDMDDTIHEETDTQKSPETRQVIEESEDENSDAHNESTIDPDSITSENTKRPRSSNSSDDIREGKITRQYESSAVKGSLSSA